MGEGDGEGGDPNMEGYEAGCWKRIRERRRDDPECVCRDSQPNHVLDGV